MAQIPRTEVGQSSLRNRQIIKIRNQGFVVLYKSFALPLMKFIVKRLGGNQEVADEVFSRTIAASFESYHTFNNKSKFFTWICRIALNKIADYYREEVNKNSKFVAPFFEEISGYDSREMSPDEWYVLNELCNSVKDCVRLLPSDKQQLLYFRFWKQMTVKQIANSLGTSERAIEGKLYRARKKLGQLITLEYPELIPGYFKK